MFHECEIGIVDVNKSPIREGDKLLVLHTDWPSKSENDKRTLSEYLDSISHTGKVRYIPSLQRFMLVGKDNDPICSLNVGPHGRIKKIYA